MKKLFVSVMVLLVTCYSVTLAQRARGSCTENIDNTVWTFGTSTPTLSSGIRPDGTTGGYHYLPVGTSSYYYEVSTAGEGAVYFWINDPGKCMANPDPGYGARGPKWGMINPQYQTMVVGIDRASWTGGCLGYSPWSSSAPSSPYWFKDGMRGSKNIPFTPGWFKWSIQGTFDNITFTIYNVDYYTIDGGDHGGLPAVHGDCAQTYDAAWGQGAWPTMFGQGWKGFALNGDVSGTGIEDISADVYEVTGNMDEMMPVSKPYRQTTWGTIKSLYGR